MSRRIRGVRRLLAAVALITLTAMGLAACTPTPKRFVVNSTADTADSKLDGVCATGNGSCTLRAALQEANSVTTHDTVAFDIPGSGTHKIVVGSQLPFLTDPAGTTVDGYTEPGSSVNTSATVSNAVIRIELQGPSNTSAVDGLDLRSPNNVVQGLAIWNFRQQVRLFGLNSHDNEVLGNFLGTNATATVGAPGYVPGSMGVHLQAGANNNRIGKPGNANRNVISGNYQHGIASYDDRTDANVVQNNIIGLKPNGSAALPNQSHGIDLNTYSANWLIGGEGEGEGNVISGNRETGVEISHGAGTVENDIIGNLIGAAPSGTSAPAYARNGSHGIDLQGVGNPDVECSSTCPADAGLSLVQDNVIVNNGFRGILITSGDHDNVVRDNYIGALRNGTPAPNRLGGIQLEKGTFGNDIGPGNVIVYNPVGIVIVPFGTDPASAAEVPTNGNTITRNVLLFQAGLGIDLAPTGAVTANPGAKVNNGIDIPTSTEQTPDEVTFETCDDCTIELFLASRGVGEHGEGFEFLGSATADSDGVAVVEVPSAARGRVVTATATDTTGSTSEFSQNVLVPQQP
jgi:CSLREA domain-containing protein